MSHQIFGVSYGVLGMDSSGLEKEPLMGFKFFSSSSDFWHVILKFCSIKNTKSLLEFLRKIYKRRPWFSEIS